MFLRIYRHFSNSPILYNFVGMNNDDYIEQLKEWQNRVGKPALYENLPNFFPEYGFRRADAGGPRDHWYSGLKLDLTQPKARTAEKTVVYAKDYTFREQGEWESGVTMINMLMQDRNLSSVYEAYTLINDTLCLDMPRPHGRDVRHPSAADRKTLILQELNRYFQWMLWNSENRNAGAVRNYLRTGRGFTEAQAKEAGFGFVPDWDRVIRHITVNKGYFYDELMDACPVTNEAGKTGVGKTYTLSIPYVCGGTMKGFVFRRIGEGSGPKYIATRGLDRKSSFFHVPETVPDGMLVVVEGEMDALTVRAATDENVAAIGGSEIAGERRKAVEDAVGRGVRSFILALDLDRDAETGEALTKSRYEHVLRSVHTILDVDIRLIPRVLMFREPTDPDEFIRKHGAGEWKRLVDEAKPYYEYIAEYLTIKRP